MNRFDRPWIDGLTFGQALAETVRRHANRDAVVFPQLNLRWSYLEFQERAAQVARALMAIGIEPGDHVGIWCTNWPQWVLVQFGTAMFGAVLVNVNPAYRTHEFSYILRQADIKALILTDNFKTSNYEAMAAEVLPELSKAEKPLAAAEYPRLRHVISIKETPSAPGIWPWTDFLKCADQTPPAKLDELSRKVTAAMPVNIQYTSGTTGAPKGAVLSHRNLLMNAFYVGQRMRFSEQDRLNIPVPFYHCFGCVMGTLMCSLYGAAMVVPVESFNPEATLKAVQAERCTALYGVPTMFNAEIHSPEFDSYDLTSLRTGIMAGSPCPIELMRQVTQRMHLTELTIAYGLTEASPVITQTETSEPLEIRVTTVGQSLPGLEVRLIDPNTGQDVPAGQPGELWVRGHGVMIGYYQMPEATAGAIDADGWLRTGDLAMLTPTGHYRITGRYKDMLIRGGENIYPREIEEFLLTHPKIRDVQVVGVPDKHYGEQVSAWVIPKEAGGITADEIREFCKGKIAHYKIPHYVAFVEQFPLTVTGKVQKYRLREMAIEQFGLRSVANQETA